MQPITRYLKSNDPLFLAAYLIVYLIIGTGIGTEQQRVILFCVFGVLLNLVFALRKSDQNFNAIVMNVLLFNTLLFSLLHR